MIKPITWDLDNVELRTVGIDIGSSTTHLHFARLHLRRLTQSLSSRFVIVERQVLHRSPVRLTPYKPGGLIDAGELGRFIAAAYRHARLAAENVDTGAVILTGTALQKTNSRAVAELFASSGGRFVCAAAGHNMEAILAAHGSGAAAMSLDSSRTVLHLDVGGGTTKLALCQRGEVLETAALAVGARVEGLPVTAMAEAVVAAASGGAPEGLMLTPPLRLPARPDLVTCSGGVSEYVFGREGRRYGDRGPELGLELARRLSLSPLPEGIRATVIGASQFSVQVSGSTVHVSRPDVLPLRNLPVVSARLPVGEPDADSVAEAVRRAFGRLDMTGAEGPVAIALHFSSEPHYGSLRELAAGMVAALPAHMAAGQPLVLAVDADVGRSLGRLLQEDFGLGSNLVVLDGLELNELDYVDVGAIVRPAGVVPVVIKSLAFPVGASEQRTAPVSGPPSGRTRTGGPA